MFTLDSVRILWHNTCTKWRSDRLGALFIRNYYGVAATKKKEGLLFQNKEKMKQHIWAFTVYIHTLGALSSG
jgi:hypothetical protein